MEDEVKALEAQVETLKCELKKRDELILEGVDLIEKFVQVITRMQNILEKK